MRLSVCLSVCLTVSLILCGLDVVHLRIGFELSECSEVRVPWSWWNSSGARRNVSPRLPGRCRNMSLVTCKVSVRLSPTGWLSVCLSCLRQLVSCRADTFGCVSKPTREKASGRAWRKKEVERPFRIGKKEHKGVLYRKVTFC